MTALGYHWVYPAKRSILDGCEVSTPCDRATEYERTRHVRRQMLRLRKDDNGQSSLDYLLLPKRSEPGEGFYPELQRKKQKWSVLPCSAFKVQFRFWAPRGWE